MDLTRCSDNIFLCVNYIWWFPSSSVAGFWILRSQAELAAWPYDFRRVPALFGGPSESHGVRWKRWRKMLKKDGLFGRVTKNVEKRWLLFFPINDERFMGFLMCFLFFNMFFYMCFYMLFLKNMYVCCFSTLKNGRRDLRRSFLEVRKKGRRLEGWTLGSHVSLTLVSYTPEI